MKCLVNRKAQIPFGNVAKEGFTALYDWWLVGNVSEWGGALLCHTAHGVSESFEAYQIVLQHFMVQPLFH